MLLREVCAQGLKHHGSGLADAGDWRLCARARDLGGVWVPCPAHDRYGAARFHESFPNAARPECWPGEEDHFRYPFQIGHHVRWGWFRDRVGVITAFGNTWSSIRAGRIVHILDDQGERDAGCWEDTLAPSHPGDIGKHYDRASRQWVDASWRQRVVGVRCASSTSGSRFFIEGWDLPEGVERVA